MMEGVQWISLGLAMVSKEFGDALYLRVGPHAFDGVSRLVYNQIELGDIAAARTIIGVNDGKLSTAVLNCLTRQAEERWQTKAKKKNRSLELVRIIEAATAELATMARNYECRPKDAEHEIRVIENVLEELRREKPATMAERKQGSAP